MEFNLLIDRHPLSVTIPESQLSFNGFKDKDLVAVLFNGSNIIAGYLMFLSELNISYPVLINLKGEAIELINIYGISRISTVPFVELNKNITSETYLEYITFKYLNINNNPCSGYTLGQILDKIKKEYGNIQFKYKIVNKHIYCNV